MQLSHMVKFMVGVWPLWDKSERGVERDKVEGKKGVGRREDGGLSKPHAPYRAGGAL